MTVVLREEVQNIEKQDMFLSKQVRPHLPSDAQSLTAALGSYEPKNMFPEGATLDTKSSARTV